MELPLGQSDFRARAVSPVREMAAYESLWTEKGTTFKRLADKFRQAPDALPSELVPETAIAESLEQLRKLFARRDVGRFGIRVHGANEYPSVLRDARNPVAVLYYQGWWDLINTSSVAVVGSREASSDGIRRTRQLVRSLVRDNFTIVSGLADGVDAAAHKAAMECNGRTIAVIGTPLSRCYTRENSNLQEVIKNEHLLISQIPFLRYEEQDYRANRSFFPERNITISALTQATIIVEASDTSGTLFQARAALSQKRKLFILDNCFQNPNITWPDKYEKKGAIRVTGYNDIRKHFSHVCPPDNHR